MSGAAHGHLEELQQSYRRSLPLKAQQVRELWDKLKFLNWSEDGVTLLQSLSHRLAGSGGAYGFPLISDRAQALDQLLQALDHQHVGDTQRARVEELVEDLCRTLLAAREVERPAAHPLGPSRSELPVLVVDDDPDLRALLNVHLAAAGYRVVSADAPSSALQCLDHEDVAAVVLDWHFPPPAVSGADAVELIRGKAGPDVPIILLSARTDLTARLQGLRSGCSGYLCKPVDVELLLSELASFAENGREPDRVLLIDDDPEILRYFQLVLSEAGMDVQSLRSPLQALQKIQRFKPTAILLDRHMPGCSGEELIRLLADVPECETVPLLLISGELDQGVIEQALHLGVTACLPKTIEHTQLVQEVRGALALGRRRAARMSGLLRARNHHGAMDRQHLMEHIDRLLGRQDETSEQAALIYLGLDQLDLVRAQHGAPAWWAMHEQLEQLIDEWLEPEAVWSPISDTVIAILCQDRPGGHAEQLADLLRRKIEQLPFRYRRHILHTSASVAIVPANGYRNGYDWLRDAEKGQRESQRQGGNRVVRLVADADVTGLRLGDSLDTAQLALTLRAYVDVDGGAPNTFSAEVQCLSPDGEWLSPAVFRPAMQQRGLLAAVDQWALTAAVRLLKREQDQPDLARVVVTPLQRNPDLTPLVAHLADLLGRAPLPRHRRLYLEVSEDWLRLHRRSVELHAGRLEELGCALSLMGYGSSEPTIDAELLQPFSQLRLSRNLIEQVGKEPAAQERAKRLISLALAHECEVLAGDIDDARTMSLLWQAGARLFRGGFVSGSEVQRQYLADQLEADNQVALERRR
ncbi:response regulator [Pseudomarimonas arenosa]|uniref:Response regulator n=1 Tax=Pseudomarimonas arenosa TaxID=2774145 RepID=A0AAW3ZJ18_9GAMM|nr:response regulator [Pseudomarimonas arenosa]MBD8524935.1 response regulator [Pseudomarimonas arenosa]